MVLFVAFSVDYMDSFVKGQTIGNRNEIAKGIVATYGEDKGYEKALDLDDDIFLSCHLFKVTTRLTERGYS